MEKNFEEREINLMDMFWAACLKWRQIVLWAVIFALLAGGFSYLKSAKAVRAAVQPEEEIALEDIKLEKDSKRNAMAFLQYKQMYEEQIRYNEKAPLMQLNANGFYREVISYYVDNHFLVEYPVMSKNNYINAMVETYQATLRSEEFMTRLIEVTGIDEKDISYETERIDCVNKYGTINMPVNDPGIMMISIYSDDEQECLELAELVKEFIISEKATVTEKFGEHDIILIEESCSCISDADLFKYQQDNISRLSTYATSLETMKGKLTDEELSYVNAAGKEQEVEEEQEVDVPAVTVSKKLIVVGFVGGAVLAFLVIVLLYLLNSRLRLEDNFERIYEIKLLGNVIVHDDEKKKWFAFIDRIFYRLRHLNKRYFQKEEAVSMIAAGIRIGAKKQGASKVYVTGTALEKEEKSIIEQLKKELKKSGIELVSGGSILYDAEALEKLAETGFTVLVERAGVALYSQIAEEIDICGHQGVKVLGAVVVAKQPL
ncbi:MAG: hypothetical protein HDR01_00750 [Lachnospiraceae bacterium]|nr:hypothetical protein [Lachnospiraceae bacterium]